MSCFDHVPILISQLICHVPVTKSGRIVGKESRLNIKNVHLNCSGSKLCAGLDQLNHSFQGYAVSIEEMNSRSERAALASWKGTIKYETYDQYIRYPNS
jgi:hypothetical protein